MNGFNIKPCAISFPFTKERFLCGVVVSLFLQSVISDINQTYENRTTSCGFRRKSENTCCGVVGLFIKEDQMCMVSVCVDLQ